ncbi:von Willebrand factor A domain-containing protein 5A [Fulvia fulva]|uniref:von Willebrand factor A domain-containing protein 5A n=1 Tax=Passalora fulva TaxID=5499 RepID=A0A9Q8LEI0_PASFU|nr:von Willebrand factor A domain-containing protein 5A [Fulvia fulva]KAK4626246.1 von Willebrand factor A domain-containing protein 5A [Fulvia fulva]UJO15933.1 von Willebrand factor A domain-containing protein 5A [Fulvia fulva]WPV13772.1 von Willebrand factor A domain-containing protein 5A [Fulvia fulva]WPV29235.1 von Willebrand factor A domain-containing protein 5A [Fulvia fulva]
MAGDHICGCYVVSNYKRRYLPQCKLTSHTTINPVCYTTQLTQVFRNASQEDLPEARYTFPLYDGVAVSGYTITYGGKSITGVVKQKDDAKKTYEAALSRGETAGLLESLPAGVFGVTLANIRAGTDITVDIMYCGELKHDAAIDGLRYNLPTSIAPRYGDYPGEVMQSNTSIDGGIRITVDVDMGKSAVRKVQSPSHPIAVSMGGLSTGDQAQQAPFQPSQASATLTQGNTELSGDFVLQLLIDDMKKPQAILETHPLLPGQRAIMTTLVPNFVLEPAHPELVFIADQSGSMSGAKNTSLVAALKVFIKSMPLGVRFNICAFGNSYKFLWPQSQAYSEKHVDEALAFVNTFAASCGGTQILEPIREAFKRRLQDLPLEVMLLTDGEIWDEKAVFGYINEQVKDKAVDGRVFALGIGQDVSHTLVEGVARAGNGFAQFVTQNEEIDQKVIRMLKGSLYAHTKDYELEVHYDTADDFEMVERVRDCLEVAEQRDEAKPAPSKAISFFDTAANPDTTAEKTDGDRYAHLPKLETPKALQAPVDVPPLFPFNRTTVYVLLGPDSPEQDVVSLTLRATAPQGPIELNIPIQGRQSGVSIHTLAARKVIQDLEQGRGWLNNASSGGKPLKVAYESRFDEMVEREAVRLGERFQIAGKWTSFVAVQENSEEQAPSLERPAAPPVELRRMRMMAAPSSTSQSFKKTARMTTGGTAPRRSMGNAPSGGFGLMSPGGGGGGGGALFSRTSSASTGAGGSQAGQSLQDYQGGLMLLEQQNKSRKIMSQGSALAAAASAPVRWASPNEECEEEDEDMAFGLFDDGPPNPGFAPSGATAALNYKENEDESLGLFGSPLQPKPAPSGDTLHRIISLQKFSGAWSWQKEIFDLIVVDCNKIDLQLPGVDKDVTATALVVAFLEKQMGSRKDVWEMVVAKARAWLRGQGVEVDENEYATTSPNAVGIDSAKLNAALGYAAVQGSSSVKVFRNGCLVGQGFRDILQERVPELNAGQTKAVVALIAGIAADRGRININAPIDRYFMNLVSGVQVNHIQGLNQVADISRMREYFAQKLVHPAGEYYEFDETTPSVVVYCIERVVEAKGYADFQNFAQKELFNKLGIPESAYFWQKDRSGVTTGYSGLWLRPLEYGRLGLLLLNNGTFGGRRILSQAFIEEARKGTSANCEFGLLGTNTFVIPSLDMVISRVGYQELDTLPGATNGDLHGAFPGNAGGPGNHEFFRLLMASITNIRANVAATIQNSGPYDRPASERVDLEPFIEPLSAPLGSYAAIGPSGPVGCNALSCESSSNDGLTWLGHIPRTLPGFMEQRPSS